MKTTEPAKAQWPRPYEKPKVRLVKPKLDSSITTTISSSSPHVKKAQEKL